MTLAGAASSSVHTRVQNAQPSVTPALTGETACNVDLTDNAYCRNIPSDRVDLQVRRIPSASEVPLRPRANVLGHSFLPHELQHVDDVTRSVATTRLAC